ncbi:MAG: hypothetical protein R2849_06860 [Thermomicrobiales bacterium]
MSDTKNGKATVTATQSRQFNPNEHLRVFERRQRQLDGSYKTVKVDYLDVKWRIVWFRTEHPNGSISTRLMSDPGVSPAVIQATVTLENGVTATGFGQCGEDDWSDWLEKARNPRDRSGAGIARLRHPVLRGIRRDHLRFSGRIAPAASRRPPSSRASARQERERPIR